MNILGIGAFVLWFLWGTPYKMTLRPAEPAVTSIQNSKTYNPADGKKVYSGGLGGGAVNTYSALLRRWERGR